MSTSKASSGLPAGLVVEFLLLSAIWGGSFLCMRIAAPELGPVPLAFLRCAIGAATLLVFCVPLGLAPLLKQYAVPLGFVGLVNSAIPFALLGYATLSLTAGTTSILNSLAPLWAAVIGLIWLGDRLTRLQMLGLLCGVCGVSVLVSGGSTDAQGSGSPAVPLAMAFAAAIAATAAYGVGANYTRQTLKGVNPFAIAAGSQLGAALFLLVPGIVFWPEVTPTDSTVWLAVVALSVVCTSLAYLLYFRLVAALGATRAVSVTFVIPVFGIGWGVLLLGETVSLATVAGAVIIVMGTALTTRFVRGNR